MGLVAAMMGLNILKILCFVKEELLIVLGTSSSEAAMPTRHRQVEGASGLAWPGVVRYLTGMTTPRDPHYAGYRHPAELISYAVWLYFRFPLSLRMAEEMLATRSISVTYG
jgi:hypothetical protein